MGPLLEHCRNILEISLEAADLAGRPLEMIDFGGGFGVPYFEKMSEFDLDGFADGFRDLLSSYRQDPRLEGCRYLFELGRYLVADAGVYVTRVVDVKETRGKTFAVTDGGMNHHLTATGNMGQVFRKAYPLLNLTRMGGVPEEGIAVAGPCCTPLDMFGNNITPGRPRGGGPDRRLLQRGLRLLGFQPGLPEPSSASRSAAVAGRGPPPASRRQARGRLERPESALKTGVRRTRLGQHFSTRPVGRLSARFGSSTLACQQVGFCRSDPRPGAHHEPLPAAVGIDALGEVTRRLAEMLTSRRAKA